MEGWIKLHRKIRNNPVFNDFQLFRLWMICLTEAYHKTQDQPIGKQIVRLEPGQFVTGRYDLHAMYNKGLGQQNLVSEKTVWRWLEKLQNADFLTINSTNKFSIITVLNWHLYQNIDQQNDQQMTNKRPTNDQQMTTNKNVKNDKNEENGKKKNTRQKYDEDSPAYKMALYFLSKIREWTDKIGEPNMQKWADDCRKILEIDKRDKHQVRDAIDWATKDEFWQANILSPAKLRKQFTTLIIQMDKEKKGGERKNAEGVQQRTTLGADKPITGGQVGWLPSKRNPQNSSM